MNCIKLDDATRCYIGDEILAINDRTMPISGLARATGISRPTLTKWLADDYRLWDLSRHISDKELANPRGRRYYTRDSRFFDHSQWYANRVIDIRRRAIGGELGAKFKAMEAERVRKQNATR